MPALYIEFCATFYTNFTLYSVFYAFSFVMNQIKAVVLLPKQSYLNGDYVLDLSYVAPNFIVSAGPTDRAVTRLFRDSVELLVEHLHRAHGDKWHIWSLRAEGRGYSSDHVTGHVTDRGVPDHQPVSVDFLADICREISEFLAVPGNIAVVHCKEGKGRSGSVFCGWHMWQMRQQGVLVSVEEAVAKFTEKRMRRGFGSGISISSQLRFLHYWKEYLESPPLRETFRGFCLPGEHCPYSEDSLKIARLTISRPNIVLQGGRILLHCYHADFHGNLREEHLFEHKLLLTANPIEIPVNVPLLRRFSNIKISIECRAGYAYTWLNLFFESVRDRRRPQPFRTTMHFCPGQFRANWNDCDGYRGTKFKSAVRLFDSLELHWLYAFSDENTPSFDKVPPLRDWIEPWVDAARATQAPLPELARPQTPIRLKFHLN